MTFEEKRRLTLLRAFAETDEKYGQLLRRTAEVDDLYLSLLRELPGEQADSLQTVVKAYMDLTWATSEVACKYMIFPFEKA